MTKKTQEVLFETEMFLDVLKRHFKHYFTDILVRVEDVTDDSVERRTLRDIYDKIATASLSMLELKDWVKNNLELVEEESEVKNGNETAK